MSCVILTILIVAYLLIKFSNITSYFYTKPTAVESVVQRCLLDTGIVVYGQKKQMLVCQDQQVVYDFNVLLGFGGLGKTRKGDLKTPLGVYTLGKIRKSKRLGTFIPIHYPTNEQVRDGFSGSEIGIHGPRRLIKWTTNSLQPFYNATHGCIVLEQDEQVSMIVKWLQTQKYTSILITP